MAVRIGVLLLFGLLTTSLLATDKDHPSQTPQLFPAGESYTQATRRMAVEGFRLPEPKDKPAPPDFPVGPGSGFPTPLRLPDIPLGPPIYPRIPRGVAFPKGQVSLVVLPDMTLTPGTGTLAVLLINDTSVGCTIELGFAFRRQVRQGDQAWAPLDWEPNPWNGPEYCGVREPPALYRPRQARIPAHGCLAFSAKRFQGSLPVRMRLVIKGLGNAGSDLVSNEFEGSVDPGQFRMGLDLSKFVLGKGTPIGTVQGDARSTVLLPPEVIEWPKILTTPPIHPDWLRHSQPWPACSQEIDHPWSERLGEAPVPERDLFVNMDLVLDAEGRLLEGRPHNLPPTWGWLGENLMNASRFQPAKVDGTPVPCVLKERTALTHFEYPTPMLGIHLQFRPAAFLGPHPGFEATPAVGGVLRPYLRVVIGPDGVIQKVTEDRGPKEPRRPEEIAELNRRTAALRFAPATINGIPIPFECFILESPRP